MQKQIDYIVKTLDEFREENGKGHYQIIEHQKETNGNVKKNTEYRLVFSGGFNTIKWVLGFVGFSNIILIIGGLYTISK